MKEEKVSPTMIENYDDELTEEELKQLVDISDIEAELMVTDWKQEAEQIPIEALSSEEQLILLKFLNDNELTNDEQDQLQQILAQYRPAIQKLKPQEQLENLKLNEQIILDEKQFLELEDDFDRIHTVPFSYPQGNKTIRMHLDIYPISDSQAILDIQNNMSLFKDLTEKESDVYQKMQTGQALTREELLIQENIQNKINKATQENQKEIMVEFLAMQCKFHDCDSSYDDMKKVFTRIPIVYLAVLFQKVQEYSNLSDVNVEEVFREFGS